MDLLWMILSVFLVCAEAEKETEVKVELGHNVTLNCSGNNSDTYWFMEINHSQVRGAISRSYSAAPDNTQYYVYTSGNKYSAFGNKLMITNITADDCRLYFCGRKINSSLQFVDTFRLVTDVPVKPSTNRSEENVNKQHSQKDFIMYFSLALNSFLLLIIGLISLLACLKKNPNKQINKSSVETVEQRQYEEIQLSPYTLPPPADLPECIYYKVQLPEC